MKTRDFNPARLDVAHLAHKQAEISGQHTHAAHGRLLQMQADAPDCPQRVVSWSARGELRPVRGGTPQVWMHLKAETIATVQCQRCLEAVDIPLALDRAFRFVADETTAATLDAELEDADVLVDDGPFDLLTLIEDELLLALPIVPMHDTCPESVNFDRGIALPDAAGEAAGNHNPAVSEHPFAALAALKRRGTGS
jgi:uncharacterized protein